MYYYRRKTNPIKWLIVALIIAAIGGLGYWYYVNYFSKIDFSRPLAVNENINQPLEELDTTITANLMASDGDVQVSINSQAYEKVLPGMVLHQQDKIKTADLSNAILKLENGAIIRLGANTEILLQSMIDKKIVIEQFQGRTYHNLPILEKYQVKYQNVFATAIGTRFEFITNNTNNLAAILDFANKVKVEIMQGDDVLLAASLDANEKALVNLKAAKKDLLKIDTLDSKILIKEAWYKWNFDQDSGQGEKLTAEVPDFSTTTDSLELAAEIKASGQFIIRMILKIIKSYVQRQIQI
ncbi:MAG: FecR domain-containing protein [Candidatus Parcubacteria bacterium]|nr:FecR domain-containing protein [Candidatus Parcubacteria bacterium]